MKTVHSITLAAATLCTAGLGVLSFTEPRAEIASAARTDGAETARPTTRRESTLDRFAASTAEPRRDSECSVAAQADHTIRPHRTHPAADVLYETTNPKHDLQVGFGAEGVRVSTGDGGAELVMNLTGVGYGADLQRVSDGALHPDGARIDYHRTTSSGWDFIEWYVNEPDGIEQSFTFAAPIAERIGGAPLTIELDCTGDFAGTVDEAGAAIDFSSHDGAHRLRYDGLYAFDATRRELASWMEIRDGRLRLFVDDARAVYPVTVDPKTRGGGKTSKHSAEVDIDDAPTQAIRSDGGGTGSADYSDGVDNVDVQVNLVRMNVKGKKAGRTASFEFSDTRRIPRDANHDYYLDAGTRPSGTDLTTGVFENSVQINSWGGTAYVKDLAAASGFKRTADVSITDLAIGVPVFMAWNVTLADSGQAPDWRLFFGPGNVGPFRAQDSQPLMVTRTTATTWLVEAVDHGQGLRAALTRRNASTNTFEVVDFYNLTFKMVVTKK